MTFNSSMKFGPYDIQSLLGAGGMGEVYRARDTRLGREVAVKVLPKTFSHDADRLRRFEQEARAVAALNHPNILAIHDIGEQDGTRFIVSELLEGASLRTELSHGAISPRKAADYAAQIAQGLAAAHEKNITHRDLKPENVFITREGRVKILDFGLAKLTAASDENYSSGGVTVTSSPTEAGVVMGTAGYMAPEQVRGGAVDSRTDIFAFGCLLYEMLSGQRAFRRDTTAETMTAILKDDPPELSETAHLVSPGLERIVRRCLEKQPEQRFQSAKDLAFALEAVSGTTSRTGAHAAIVDQPKKRPRVLLAAASALGLVLGGALVWLLRPAPAAPPTFSRVSYHRGEVVQARFAPDGKTVVYSAKLNGGPLDTYIIREDYPEPVAVGLHGAALLAVSRQGQMAAITHPKYFAHRQWYGTLATALMGGGAPRELLDNVGDADFSPDGNELAVLHFDQGKLRVEYPIGKVLLEGKNWLSDLRVSPDGEHLALFRHPPNVDDRGDVILLDRSGNLRELSKGWESLEGLAWAPSGKEIYFSAAETGEQYCIRAVNLSGKQRTVYCGMAPTLIHDIAASGSVLVSSQEHRVSMAMVEHGSNEEHSLNWLDYPYQPRLSWDGGALLFTDQSEHAGGSYSVYVRKTDGSPAVRIAGGGFGADLSPDGKWALVVLPDDPAARLQIVPTGAGQARVFHWDGIRPLWAFWFPDGQHILLQTSPAEQGVGIYLTDTNGATPKQLTTAADDLSPVSPDGRSFIAQRDGKWVVHFIQENSDKPITALRADEFPIAWAADSKHIFTQAASDGGISLSRIDLDSGRREPWQVLRPKEQIGLRPVSSPTAITPDGRWIAFTYGTQLGQLYRSDNLE